MPLVSHLLYDSVSKLLGNKLVFLKHIFLEALVFFFKVEISFIVIILVRQCGIDDFLAVFANFTLLTLQR